MNARTLGVLLVLLAALGGGALLMQRQEGAIRPDDAASLGQPLLKGLQAAQVASVSIRTPKAALTLRQKDGRWTIAERADFPADLDKVRDFVVKAIELKIGQSDPLGDADRARLNLDASGTRVEFLGADGKPLAALVAGRKYFKAEPENPEKALGDGRYVALPADAKQAYVVADPLAQASTASADWIRRTGIAAEKVRSLEVRDAAGAAWKIERSGDNADWKLAGAGGADKLDVTKANAAAYTLSQLDLADVAPAGAKPEDTGLDKPSVAVATTFDGLTYTVKAGKASGDAVYATIEVAGEPKPEGKDAEERLKKLNARLPAEKALAGYVLLLPKSKLDDIFKKRAELLEKKEAKKK